MAVDELSRLGATTFIHCGDFESIECLDPLAGLDAHVVFGNCDEPSDLEGYARSIGITVHHPLGEIVVDGMRVAFTHGDQDEWVRRALDSHPAWFFYGHTHVKRDAVVDSTRLVNPGALQRANSHTVAIVTPASKKVEFVTIA